jgi:hypothetical protein
MLTQTPPQTLTFRCPHCGTMVQVEPSADGAVVNCPALGCGKPFRVEIPVARPVIMPGQPGAPVAAPAVVPPGPKAPMAAAPPRPGEMALPVTTPGNEPEQDVRTFHLSMFRRYPWRCLGYLLVVTAGVGGAMWLWLRDWQWLSMISLGVGAFAFLRLAIWWLRMHRTTFTLTNKRAILRTGVFSQDSAAIELQNLADYHLHQSLLMRLLNVGDFAIVSAQPHEQQIVIMALPDPEAATRILEPHLEARRKALAAAEGTAGSGATVVTAPEPVHVG